MSEEIWTTERKALALACCHKWHGTKHQNRIAIPGVGIDCVNFIHEIMVDAGLVERLAFTGYEITAGMHDPSNRLYWAFTTALFLEPVNIRAARFGDIAIGQTGTQSAHVGFVGDGELWHALAGQMVTCNPWNIWRHGVAHVLRFTQTGWKTHPQNVTKL